MFLSLAGKKISLNTSIHRYHSENVHLEGRYTKKALDDISRPVANQETIYQNICFPETSLIFLPMKTKMCWKLKQGIAGRFGNSLWNTTHVTLLRAILTLTSWQIRAHQAPFSFRKIPPVTKKPVGCRPPTSRWTKWPPFRRRRFQMQFHEWKFLYFDSNFTEFCS